MPRLVLVELGLAHLDQALELLPAELMVTYQRVNAVLPLDDPVASEDASDHVSW